MTTNENPKKQHIVIEDKPMPIIRISNTSPYVVVEEKSGLVGNSKIPPYIVLENFKTVAKSDEAKQE